MESFPTVRTLVVSCILLSSEWAPFPSIASAAEKPEYQEPAASSKNGNSADVVAWDFEQGLQGKLLRNTPTDHSILHGQLMGQARLGSTGPDAQFFEGFPEENQALELPGAGSYLRIADQPGAGPLDFGQDDPLTLESWIRVDSMDDQSYAYVVAKGRTYEQEQLENQNYALRIAKAGKAAKISFLFSTRNSDGNLQYHRWTSNDSFLIDGQWHHIAVSYRFGDPESLQGYIDGQSTGGKWDMAGKTSLPPVQDDDSLWIGSARAGDAGNSLVGAVDEVRIHHRILGATELESRFEPKPWLPQWPTTASDSRVTVTLHEGWKVHTAFPSTEWQESFRFTTPRLAMHRLPMKYSTGGARQLWTGPLLLRAYASVEIPSGEVEFLIRSPGLSRIWIDGIVRAETPARRLFPDAHQPFIVYEPDLPWLRVPHVGDHEVRFQFASQGGMHQVIFESLVGGKDSRCELGETLVAMRQQDAMFTLLSPTAEQQEQGAVHLVDSEFSQYVQNLENELHAIERQLLEDESAREDDFWTRRHQIAKEVVLATWPQPAVAGIDDGIRTEVAMEGIPAATELEFLRRLTLDTVGVPPSLEEIAFFQSLPKETRRDTMIERMLADERWADHWTSYWQDVLAENPSILKPSLNNTGPFRLWIHDSLLLNKPMDRFVTELLRMEGDPHAGAAAGFRMATQNDVPMAEKAHVTASAYLGVDMKCARCHDAPYHPWTQRDLFSIGAMLEGKPLQVPASSSVPAAFFDRHDGDASIAVTLQPGESVEPKWPSSIFPSDEFGTTELSEELLGRDQGPREQLAALITRAENRRFAKVTVNRAWTRLMGWGLMTSTDDWYEATARHPQVLDYLAREFVLSGYDLKHVARLILQSEIYGRRAVDPALAERSLVYAAPWHRRMSAEQLVDSMHSVTGMPLDTEPITFDPEASQKIQNFLNLGSAERAWQLISLSNERDRPSLSLPKAAAVVQCLEAFGWRPTRQSPTTHREMEANIVQPGVVANSHVTTRVTRLTDHSAMTQLAIEAPSVDDLVRQLFMAVLTRPPTEDELRTFADQLQDGFEERILPETHSQPEPPRSRGFVTWSNHFAIGANKLMREIEQEVATGPASTSRLQMDWRERTEDAVWALLNSPEFQLVQ